MQTATEVGYTAPDGSYVIRPQSDGRVLLLTKVSILNPNATLASLMVDERAIVAEDTLGHRYRIVNPWVQREATPRPIPKDGAFVPLLWGVAELKEGYNVSGWVMFELPPGAIVRGLIWNQVETIRLSFPDKAG